MKRRGLRSEEQFERDQSLQASSSALQDMESDSMDVLDVDPAASSSSMVEDPHTGDDEEKTVRLSTAASRRKRKKLIGASIAAGERSFPSGSNRSQEYQDAYVRDATRIGGAAGRAADMERKKYSVLAVGWPIAPSGYPGELYHQLVAAGQSKNVVVLIRPSRENNQGNLILKFDPSNADAMAQIFWHCVSATQAILDDDAFDFLELPSRWKTYLHANAATPTRLRLEANDSLVTISNIRVNLARVTCEVLGEPVRNDDATPFQKSFMATLVFRCLAEVLSAGNLLIRLPNGDNVREPIGMRRLITAWMGSETQPANAFGSSKKCFKAFGDCLRGSLAYKTKFDFYTAGHQSLQQEFPGQIKVFTFGTPDVMDKCKHFIEDQYQGIYFDWLVNALPLKAERRFRPSGHLGNHPMNLANFLSAGNAAWRLEQYVMLWLRLQCTMMCKENDMDDTVNALYMCRQGKHRSFGWSLIEATILSYFGFVTHHVNVCRWAQEKEKCQIKNYPHGCEHCGCVLSRNFQLSNVQEDLLAAAVDEFYEVVTALEALVDPQSTYPWHEQ